jgi:hypothetical protein
VGLVLAGLGDNTPAKLSQQRGARSDPRQQLIEQARVRHGLPLHQRLSCDCSLPQTGMITAAALTLPHLRPTVTRVLGQHEAPPADGGCDLGLRNQGHDLHLPYLYHACPTR